MTKDTIIKQIHRKEGIEPQVIKAVLEDFMDIVKDSVADGQNVYLRGFGTFGKKHRKAKVARNISEKQTIIIPEHDIPYFKPGKDFKV